MKYYVEVGINSLNKYGEELCGDTVEIIKKQDSTIIVMADGLGSGVKANILSTLTAKIAGTMLKAGESIYETVDTIAQTLPECNIRKLAYSTFTIMEIKNNRNVYMAEYDNPPFFLLRQNKIINVDKTEIQIKEKTIYESNFYMDDDDMLVIVSDGVIHSGIGKMLPLGWKRENLCRYIQNLNAKEKFVKTVSRKIVEACSKLYMDEPGDDTTVIAVKLKKTQIVNLFTGPPKNRGKDASVIKELTQSEGKKVICGGTAANIAQRILGEKIEVDIDTMTREIPPVANLKGFDLVTEGVITLSKTVEIMKDYVKGDMDNQCWYECNEEDGVSQLFRMLVYNCTHLNLWIGKAVNSAHQNPNLPIDLRIKLKVVEELVELMKMMGKTVDVKYID